MAIPVSSAYRIFWSGRYLERADSLARLMDTRFYEFLESGTDEDEQKTRWIALLKGVGMYELFARKYGNYTVKNVYEFMIFSPDNPSSIRTSLQQAKENISGAMPDAVFIETNKLLQMIQESSIDEVCESPHDFLSKIIQGCALISGLIDRLWS